MRNIGTKIDIHSARKEDYCFTPTHRSAYNLNRYIVYEHQNVIRRGRKRDIFHGGIILTLSSRLLNRPMVFSIFSNIIYFQFPDFSLKDFEIEACQKIKKKRRTFRLQINTITYFTMLQRLFIDPQT